MVQQSSIYSNKKGLGPFLFDFLFSVCLVGLLLKTRIVCIERKARRTAMNAVLGSYIALTVFHTGRPAILLRNVLVCVRCTLKLRKLEPTVATLEKRAVYSFNNRLFFFFRFWTGVTRAALTAAVRIVAAFTFVLLLYKVITLHYKKAKPTSKAKVADHTGMVHGFLDRVAAPYAAVLSFNFF